MLHFVCCVSSFELGIVLLMYLIILASHLSVFEILWIANLLMLHFVCCKWKNGMACRSPSQEKEEALVAQSDVNIRNVFGSSDDEDAEEYVRNDIEADEPVSLHHGCFFSSFLLSFRNCMTLHVCMLRFSFFFQRSPIEDEEGSEKDQRPDDMMLDDDMVPEEDPRYESEDERVEVRHRERPVGPPLEVEVPFRPPPGDPEKVYVLYVALKHASAFT